MLWPSGSRRRQKLRHPGFLQGPARGGRHPAPGSGQHKPGAERGGCPVARGVQGETELDVQRAGHDREVSAEGVRAEWSCAD